MELIKKPQNIIIYEENKGMSIDDHIKIINELKEANSLGFIDQYFLMNIRNSDLLELKKRINEIEDEDTKDLIIYKVTRYISRMNKLQYALDNNKLKEYIEELTQEELLEYARDLSEENVTLTMDGIKVSNEIYLALEKIKRK